MEIIKLNLIPNGVNPTCHCSQYDEGRVIRIELFDGLTPYTLQSGDTVTLNVRKPDNTIVTTTVETTQGNNYVDILTTEQICACVGYNLCDLTITNGSKVIGTLNFIMAIERDVLADGIPSQSVIEDLDELVQEAVGDNYYTKDETEELIDNEIKDVYPLGESSGAIASFNTGVIMPLKSLTAEIKATETGSGEKSPSNPYIINGFDNGVITRCGKNLFSYDLPIRDGYWTDNAFVGTNAIVPKENANGWQYIRVYVEGLSSITLSGFDNQGGTNCAWLSSENANDVISRFNSLNKNGTKTVPSGAKYLCLTIYNIKNKLTTYPNAQLEIGDTATTFEAYNGNNYEFTFEQTVYGGKLNVTTGELTVTQHGIVIDGSTVAATALGNVGNNKRVFIPYPIGYTAKYDGATIDFNCDKIKPSLRDVIQYPTQATETAISTYTNGIYAVFVPSDNVTDLASANAWFASYQPLFVYTLETPYIVQLTPTEVKTLLGENNIFTNTNGNVDVIYHHALTAKNIYFDNTGTALQADNVEDAIKEILTLIQGGNNSRALNLSKGSLKVEAPVSNEEPAIEEDPTTEEEPEAISDSESEPTSDEER